jgi:thiamine pyrophosphate-dependent acetolactate synthase large subunit-like protein
VERAARAGARRAAIADPVPHRRRRNRTGDHPSGLPRHASDAQLSEAAELLASAERPVVISGSGVDRASANTELREIVELLGCPVLSTPIRDTSASRGQ